MSVSRPPTPFGLFLCLASFHLLHSGVLQDSTFTILFWSLTFSFFSLAKMFGNYRGKLRNTQTSKSTLAAGHFERFNTENGLANIAFSWEWRPVSLILYLVCSGRNGK